ncbi:hypothetical protein T05_13081 [Trichinella murrelli]|uniref:Uncharacterized protein n=1 Tax=Trichinella murrelli TaxID=144512 RepID=A0A0V0TN61_9BILA|nr:hypothetical protein T05_13081 [Trichinella murrelli]
MFAKQLDKGHIWLGAIAWTGVLRSSIIATKTEEETEGFLASEKEANEEERLSSHEKNFEENESIVEKILPHKDLTFMKA